MSKKVNSSKNKHIFNVCLSVWVVLFFVYIVFLGFRVYSVYEEYTLAKNIGYNISEKDGLSYDEELSESYFVIEGDVSDLLVLYANVYYLTIPKDIRDEFFEDGWRVVLTDKSISKNYYNGQVKGRLAGVTRSEDKTIYVHASYSDVRRSLIHEFGHYLDYNTGMTSLSEIYKGIYNKEMNSLNEKWKIDSHGTSNQMEYFAEVFERYVLYPSDCKKEVPESSRFLGDLLF